MVPFSESTDGIKERAVIRRMAGVAQIRRVRRARLRPPRSSPIPVITCVLVGPGRKLHRAIHSINAFSLK